MKVLFLLSSQTFSGFYLNIQFKENATKLFLVLQFWSKVLDILFKKWIKYNLKIMFSILRINTLNKVSCVLLLFLKLNIDHWIMFWCSFDGFFAIGQWVLPHCAFGDGESDNVTRKAPELSFIGGHYCWGPLLQIFSSIKSVLISESDTESWYLKSEWKETHTHPILPHAFPFMKGFIVKVIVFLQVWNRQRNTCTPLRKTPASWKTRRKTGNGRDLGVLGFTGRTATFKACCFTTVCVEVIGSESQTYTL